MSNVPDRGSCQKSVCKVEDFGSVNEYMEHLTKTHCRPCSVKLMKCDDLLNEMIAEKQTLRKYGLNPCHVPLVNYNFRSDFTYHITESIHPECSVRVLPTHVNLSSNANNTRILGKRNISLNGTSKQPRLKKPAFINTNGATVSSNFPLNNRGDNNFRSTSSTGIATASNGRFPNSNTTRPSIMRPYLMHHRPINNGSSVKKNVSMLRANAPSTKQKLKQMQPRRLAPKSKQPPVIIDEVNLLDTSDEEEILTVDVNRVSTPVDANNENSVCGQSKNIATESLPVTTATGNNDDCRENYTSFSQMNGNDSPENNVMDVDVNDPKCFENVSILPD